MTQLLRLAVLWNLEEIIEINTSSLFGTTENIFAWVSYQNSFRNSVLMKLYREYFAFALNFHLISMTKHLRQNVCFANFKIEKLTLQE